MRKIILCFCLCTFTFYAFSQESILQKQNKKEMYKDFDTLVSNIKAVSPHILIKKELWYYDALSKIAKLRKQIDTIQSKVAFEKLINQAIYLCQDEHTSIMSVSESYQKLIPPSRLYLPISYIDGSYFLSRSIINDGTVLPIGSKIIKINNYSPDRYVASIITGMVLRYDLKRKKFYTENFYKNMDIQQKGGFNLTFKTIQGKKIQSRFNPRARVAFQKTGRDTIMNQVNYWAADQVLYIKIFRMDEQLIPFFKRKIAGYKSMSSKIKKVIIDVRDNIGGSDMVWQSVYEAILPGKVTYPLQIDGFYPHKLSSEYLMNREIDTARLEKNKNSLLKSYGLYHFLNRNWVLTPTDSTLNFKGKLIIIGNENIYSSGASIMLLANANHQDNIFSIGRKTGMFLGAGYSPVLFELPNSGIKYRIEPALDVTNVSTLNELMHDEYEFSLNTTLEELYQKEKFDGNTLGYYYMKNFDPLIIKALAL